MAENDPARTYHEALSSLLWTTEDAYDGAIETIGAYAEAHEDDAVRAVPSRGRVSHAT